MPQRWQRRTGRVRCQKNAYGRPSCCGAAILTAEAHANGIGRATESIERANWAEETERQGQPRRARGTGACRAPHRRRAHAQAAAGACAGGAIGAARACRAGGPRPGAGAGGGSGRAAPAGRARARAQELPRAAAAGRQGPPVADPARRRRPARLSRHAPARGRRSRRRDHAARPRGASLRQTRQRRAAARRRARGGHSRRPGWRASQHPGLAVAAVDSHLWRRDRAPHRRGRTARGAARHLGQARRRRGGLGRAARRTAPRHRIDPARRAWAHRGPAGLHRRRVVGAGRGCRAGGAIGGRRQGQDRRRPLRGARAARRRCSPPPERR